VADVEVNRRTGDVHVSRVVVGQDAGLMINPAGVQHQIHGNVVQTTSRALKEGVALQPGTQVVNSREWGSYPILSFREVPVIEVMMMPRPGEPALGAGESSSVPGTAAIANAIFDATGVRFRQPPFTPELVRAALSGLDTPGSPAAPKLPSPGESKQQRAALVAVPMHRRHWLAAAGAIGAGLMGLLGAALGWRASIAPVAASTTGVYSASTIETGRRLAAVGNCIECHTAPRGAPGAGGRAIETPYGTVFSTNLTPDLQTGIGRWSFSAFQRAMREGVSRDGRHLYPAFPYPAFTRTADDDLLALYAYLMGQPAVDAQVPPSRLAFPYGVRPLLSLWNALFLEPGPLLQDAARSAQWNRGAYLVNGLGHCGACHTPRNAFGAEREHSSYLDGAVVEGWEAPALNSSTHAPVPWSEDELFRYLRSGHTLNHGSVAGPMAAVVRDLSAVPDTDLWAMAHYLATLNASTQDADTIANTAVERSLKQGTKLRGVSQRLFSMACGACHHDGDGPLTLGRNLPLALYSSLHSARPNNLLRIILEGIDQPATRDIGFMPAFKDSLDDSQIADLAAYMRQRYAPDKPGWVDLLDVVAQARHSVSVR
jgi:nicotinate dehydrogenase subunit B